MSTWATPSSIQVFTRSGKSFRNPIMEKQGPLQFVPSVPRLKQSLGLMIN